MKEDLVSVIIPIYNASKYLSNTIECILNQTYRNLEIILLNDGSTDNSLCICNEYRAKDDRIIVIDKPNSGQGDTRNKGIEVASGKYIYFADSDDLMDLKLIETAVCGIKDNDLYVFNYYHSYERKDGGRTNQKERDFLEGDYRIGSDKERLKFISNYFLNYGCGFEVWNRLYRADIIKNRNISFPVFKPVIAEDACFNLFYLMHVNKLKVTNERLYYYLYRADSSMGSDRGIVRANQYNRLSKCLYDYLDSISYRYMISNFCVIHVRLLYHELMNLSLKDVSKELSKIEDYDFNSNRLAEARRKPLLFIEVLGFVKGIKYYFLSRYYYIKNDH